MRRKSWQCDLSVNLTVVALAVCSLVPHSETGCRSYRMSRAAWGAAMYAASELDGNTVRFL
jgi:hypothetical protein